MKKEQYEQETTGVWGDYARERTEPANDAVVALHELYYSDIGSLDARDIIALQSAIDRVQERLRNHRCLNVDVYKYESWTVPEIIYWISTLENGRFIIYLDQLLLLYKIKKLN